MGSIIIKTIIKVFKRRLSKHPASIPHDVISHSKPASSILQMKTVNPRKFKQEACQNSNSGLTPEFTLFPQNHITSQENKMFHKEIIIELDNTKIDCSGM